MEVKELVKVVWCNEPVLTTAQTAAVYGCTPTRIKDNFRLAKEYFKEGVHYFKVTGAALRELKHSEGFAPLAISKMTSCLYLWTKQGVARHCKMLNTQKAWDVFDALERFYFAAINPAPPALATTEINEELIRLQNQIAKPCTNLAVVYVLLMSNFTVKIGMTKDLTDRIKQIQAESGLFVLNFASTKFLPREEAARLEKSLKEKYAADSLGGEFFDVKFKLVAAQL